MLLSPLPIVLGSDHQQGVRFWRAVLAYAGILPPTRSHSAQFLEYATKVAEQGAIAAVVISVLLNLKCIAQILDTPYQCIPVPNIKICFNTTRPVMLTGAPTTPLSLVPPIFPPPTKAFSNLYSFPYPSASLPVAEVSHQMIVLSIFGIANILVQFGEVGKIHFFTLFLGIYPQNKEGRSREGGREFWWSVSCYSNGLPRGSQFIYRDIAWLTNPSSRSKSP